MSYQLHFIKEKKLPQNSSFKDFISIVGTFLGMFAMLFFTMMLVCGVFFVLEIGLDKINIKKVILYGPAVISVLYLIFYLNLFIKKPDKKQEIYQFRAPTGSELELVKNSKLKKKARIFPSDAIVILYFMVSSFFLYRFSEIPYMEYLVGITAMLYLIRSAYNAACYNGISSDQTTIKVCELHSTAKNSLPSEIYTLELPKPGEIYLVFKMETPLPTKFYGIKTGTCEEDEDVNNKDKIDLTSCWSDQKKMLELNCKSMTDYWMQLPTEADLYSQIVENISLYGYCHCKYASDETKEKQSPTQMHAIYQNLFNNNDMVERLFATIDPEPYCITLLRDLLLCGLFEEFDSAITTIRNNVNATRINENYQSFLADILNTALEDGIFSNDTALFYEIQKREYLLTIDSLHEEFVSNCEKTKKKMYDDLSFKIWDLIDHDACDGIQLWNKVLKENYAYLSDKTIAEMLIDEVVNSSFYDPEEASTIAAYKEFLNHPKLTETVITNCTTMDDPIGYLVLFARKQKNGTIQVTGEDILSSAKRNQNVSNGHEALEKIIGYLIEEEEEEE